MYGSALYYLLKTNRFAFRTYDDLEKIQLSNLASEKKLNKKN